MKALVLAAGKGTRMLPLTKDKPKGLINVSGKPFIYHVIERLKKAGFDDIAVIVGYKAEQMCEYFYKNYPQITIIEQKEQLGTAHAVLQAETWAGKDNFLLVMGDNLYSPRDMKNIAKKQLISIGAMSVDDPTKYGVLVCDKNKLIRIDEKPKVPASNLVNTGMYFLTNDIFGAIKKIKKSNRGEYELTDAMTFLAKEKTVHVYVLKGYWIDFGKPEDIPVVEAFLRKDYNGPTGI
jgi:dTDP-glucose pyrophosphorylase